MDESPHIVIPDSGHKKKGEIADLSGVQSARLKRHVFLQLFFFTRVEQSSLDIANVSTLVLLYDGMHASDVDFPSICKISIKMTRIQTDELVLAQKGRGRFRIGRH